MPERLDRVIVATTRRQVELPWAVRDMLLERLERFPSAAAIVTSFEAVGASRSVHLTNEQEAMLHEVVQEWENEVGADNVPPSILELRDALRDVTLVYSRGEVEIEWDSRTLLLERLQRVEAAAEIATTFETVGASKPIRLPDDQMTVLLVVVSVWLEEVGVTRLPPGIFRLRNALEDHRHDTHMANTDAD